MPIFFVCFDQIWNILNWFTSWLNLLVRITKNSLTFKYQSLISRMMNLLNKTVKFREIKKIIARIYSKKLKSIVELFSSIESNRIEFNRISSIKPNRIFSIFRTELNMSSRDPNFFNISIFFSSSVRSNRTHKNHSNASNISC